MRRKRKIERITKMKCSRVILKSTILPINKEKELASVQVQELALVQEKAQEKAREKVQELVLAELELELELVLDLEQGKELEEQEKELEPEIQFPLLKRENKKEQLLQALKDSQWMAQIRAWR